MNFKDWEKLEENEKSVTLVHPKGHTMVIALKSLPKIHQEAIKRLKFAEGGSVHSEETRRHANEKGVHKPDSEQPELHSKYGNKEHFRRSKVHEIINDNADDEPRENKIRNQKAKDEHHRVYGELKAQKNPNLKGLAGGGSVRKYYEDGSKDGVVSENDSAPEQSQPAAAPAPTVIVNTAAPQPQAQAPQAPEAPKPVLNPATEYANKEIQVEQPQIPEARPNTNPNGTMNPSAVAENEQSAVQGQAAINASAAKAEGQNQQALMEAQAKNQQNLENKYQELNKRADAFAKYASNPENINPKHYQENMGSGRKVATALGLFMGGLSVPFGGHNFAQDFLNQQIDRDIQAQKDRMDSQKTIYGAYHQLYGDSQATYNLTKAALLDIQAAKAKGIAAQLGTPQAAQAALKMGAETAIEKSKLLKDSAVELSNLPGTHSGAMQMKSQKEMPQGNSMGAKKDGKAAAPQEAARERILLPNGDKLFEQLQYKPQIKEFLPQIMEQRSRAAMADKALDTIDSYFPKVTKSAGDASYVREHLEPFLSGLPFIGSSLASGAHAFSDTKSVRSFESGVSALKGAVRGALNGNVSDALLDSTLEANLPKKGDEKNPELLKEKLETLKRFIHDHTKTDMLEFAGLSKKK